MNMQEAKYAAKELISNPQHFRHTYEFKGETFFASESEIERGQIHMGVLENSVHIKECPCRNSLVKSLLAR